MDLVTQVDWVDLQPSGPWIILPNNLVDLISWMFQVERVQAKVDLVYLSVPGGPFVKGLVGYKSLRSGVPDCSGGPDM